MTADLPQPGQPTMNLLHPERLGLVEGLGRLLRRHQPRRAMDIHETEAVIRKAAGEALETFVKGMGDLPLLACAPDQAGGVIEATTILRRLSRAGR